MVNKNESGVISLAIIPDGNRRWARKQGLPAIAGHTKGARVFKETVKACWRKGIRYVTFYAFSTENWKRSEAEVSALMSLLRKFLDDYEAELGEDKEKIRIRVIGDRTALSPELLRGIERVEQVTAENTDITVNIAINYGSRNEMITGIRKIAAGVKEGSLVPEEISEDTFSRVLDTADVPDPDLLIRTSGEMRISNFLLWQLAYSELYFADVYWPDFDEEQLDMALEAFRNRKRRFGS